MLAGAMIAWSSKRQPVTAISSTESVSQCALDCVYLRRIMELLRYQQTAPNLIAQDKNVCIFLIKGSGMYAHAKHIDTRVHRVKKFAAGDKPKVKLYKIAGEYKPADIFTKGLPRVAFQLHRALSWLSELKFYMRCLLLPSVSAYHSAYYIYMCYFGCLIDMPYFAITVMLLAHISYAYVVLNPPHCKAAGMMESGGSFLYAS